MIDIKKLRDEFDATAAELGRRGVEIEKLQKARDLDAKRRALIAETETLKAKRNAASKEIGKIAASGGDIAAAKDEMRKVGDRYEHVGQRDFTHLRYVMICGCGFPNSKHNFEPAAAQFKLCFPNDHTIITVPESPMFNAPEAQIVTAPRLEKIKEAGRQFAENYAVSDDLMAEITSPMIPEKQYAEIVNGTVN
jgi:hypothetical protein